MSEEESTIISDFRVSKVLETPTTSFVEWGLVEIENWLTRLNFDHGVITKFTSNNITGDLLPYLKDDHFSEMELSIKDKIKLKIEINKLTSSQNYLDPNSLESIKLVLTNINSLIQSNLDASTRTLNDEFFKLRDDLGRFQKPLPTPDKNPTSPFNLSSPTKNSKPSTSTNSSFTISSPNEPYQTLQRKHSESKQHSKSNRNSALFSSNSNHPSNSSLNSISSPTNSSSTLQPQPAKPVSEPLKQLRASTDDPCSKILQAAMKRHKLNDDWRNYALVICYGDQERILDLDEKPVQIFKELRENGKHPAIMLRQKADFSVEPGKKLSETPGGKL